jgi:outer membrane protein OmpA-like peptidoglycan-associated protein
MLAGIIELACATNKKGHLMKLKGLVIALGLVSTVAMAADDWDYAVNSSDTVWRNSSGECWHMGWRDETFKPLPDCGDAVVAVEVEVEVVEPEPVVEPAPAAPVAIVLTNVGFASNSDELTPESQPALDDMAEQIKQHPEITKIDVVGHTDNTGAAAYNKDLSQRRAQSVVDYMTSVGVTVPMTAIGMGEEEPVADNNTREGRAQNRRVEMDIYK